jgi:hypothetical protein
VPADCHDLFNAQRQVWTSLGTDRLERAKVMLGVEVGEFDLSVAWHRKERAARAASAMGLPSAAGQTSSDDKSAGPPEGSPSLELLRRLEASLEQ